MASASRASMPTPFVHLHLHSEYSLADSTIRVPELVARSVAQGQPAVAITDRNNLFALVKFYRAAEAAGIKPIAGADVLLADGSDAPSRLTLLCRDHGGYLTLSRLLTRAWMEGQRHDGVFVRPQWLRESNAGLFALAGRHAHTGQLLAGGRLELAEQALSELQRDFGDRLHLELTRCGLDGEAAFNDFALHVSSKLGIPVVASNDVRFLDADGFDAHEARVCIASGRVLDDPAPSARLHRRAVPEVVGGHGVAVRRRARRHRQRGRTRPALQPRADAGPVRAAGVSGARRPDHRHLAAQLRARTGCRRACGRRRWPTARRARTMTRGWSASSTSSCRWASPATS